MIKNVNNISPDIDINGNNKEYYEKLFPKNYEFIYNSPYGSKLKLVSEGICKTIRSENGILYAKFHIITYVKGSKYKITYEVEKCISLLRQEKLKRLLND